MSETAKHTPGPWRVDTDDDDFPIIGHPSWPCTRFGVEGEWEIAKVEDLYEDHEEERAANARLIAAAPDLLEAVYILNHHANLQFPEDDPDYTKDIAFVVAAINKAEGRA